MSFAALVLLLALAADSPAKPEAAALVVKLGSADPAEQAAATEALKALGRDALPAMEKAMKAKDTDLGKRVSAVWDIIQRELMVRPSLVRLDARNQSFEEVLEDLSKQTGMSLRMSTNRGQNLVGLHEPVPITFWTAVDRLGLKGVYQQTQEFGKFPTLDFQTEPNWEFTSTSGPFHVSLTGLHWHHDRHLIGAPWVRIDRFGQRINAGSEDLESDRINYYGGLQVMVEPRVWFSLEGPARLTDATDNLGQSLVTDKPGLGTGMSDHYPGKDFIGDYLRDRIEFVDAGGRPLSVNLPFPNPTANANGEFLVQTLVSGATAAQLRIYHLSRLATEIPFEFNDVPSP